MPQVREYIFCTGRASLLLLQEKFIIQSIVSVRHASVQLVVDYLFAGVTTPKNIVAATETVTNNDLDEESLLSLTAGFDDGHDQLSCSFIGLSICSLPHHPSRYVRPPAHRPDLHYILVLEHDK